jgi:hypothetical protein
LLAVLHGFHAGQQIGQLLLRSLAADAYICIMVWIRLDPPNTRMWRDDLTITANRSGLRLGLCSVLVVFRQTPSGDDRRRADGLPITRPRNWQRKKEVFVACFVLDIEVPIQGGTSMLDGRRQPSVVARAG